MAPPTASLVSRLADAGRLLEVGIGDRPGVAAGLVAAGADVRATDVRRVAVPPAVRFRVEDVTQVGSVDEFHEVETVYALNCPPELHEPVRTIAARVDATFLFTTLGHDQPEIPVERETLTGEPGAVDEPAQAITLYRANPREATRRQRR